MTIKFSAEILRKLVHVSSLWIPLLYLIYFSERAMISILFPLTVLAIIIEVSRKLSPELNALIDSYLGNIMREEEGSSFSGATYMLIASTLSIMFFSKDIAILSLSVLMVSDSCAALVGRRYGKTRVGEKSLEGSCAFFLSGIMVYYLLVMLGDFKISLIPALIAIFTATIVELFSKKLRLNDNLTIALVMGIILSIG